ncbi:hypothetical protein D3C85_1605800 [compost metagenome]
MPAGDMPHRISHGHHRQTEGQRYAQQAYPQFGKGGRQHRTATTSQHQPEGPQKLGSTLFHMLILLQKNQTDWLARHSKKCRQRFKT